MTPDEALASIHAALEKTLDKAVVITPETDLFADKVLDSLDTMLFFLNLGELTGAQFPEKDIVESGLGKVSTLVAHLVQGA
jgi:acyl carrier protein